MTKQLSYIIYSSHVFQVFLGFMMLLAFVCCSDETDEQPGRDVTFCVRAAWQNGFGGNKTRALSATDLLSNGTDDIVINPADYPAVINVHCSDGTDFTLTKGSNSCHEHAGNFWQYTPSTVYIDNKIIREDYSFDFTASIDNSGDELEGTATKDDINGNHMLVTLHHTKALLRFSFKVSAEYDKIRFIKVTRLTLNGNECVIVEKILSKDNSQLIAYAYVDPTLMTVSQQNTLACTYNIYDRDNAADNHLTREGVTATNSFKFSSLKDAGGNAVTELYAGYYYNLNVTLNPAYLYVMAEHDNKHMTVN